MNNSYTTVTLNAKLKVMSLNSGYFSGYTINFFADIDSTCDIYGFDSFEGLPENWQGYHYFDFNRHGSMPDVRENVKLIPDGFLESIPKFLNIYEKRSSFCM